MLLNLPVQNHSSAAQDSSSRKAHWTYTHLTSCTLEVVSVESSPVLSQLTSSRLNSLMVKPFHTDLSHFVCLRFEPWFLLDTLLLESLLLSALVFTRNYSLYFFSPQ